MATVKLGHRPKTFKPCVVKIEMNDGEIGEIPVTFKYRTQDEYWQYRDEFFKAIGVAREDRGDTSLPVIAQESRMKAAAHMIGALDSWGLDIQLTPESLCDLFNEQQQSLGELVNAYQRACVDGRLGN